MKTNSSNTTPPAIDENELIEPVVYQFGLNRRTFVQVLSAGLAIAFAPLPALAQRNGGRGGGSNGPLASRIIIGKDGSIVLLTGKVEVGQGARAELTQAAAEELRVPASMIQLTMADTGLVPDDGMTVGSRTTPATVPVICKAAASAREVLASLACTRWGVEKSSIEIGDGKISHPESKRVLSYGELAQTEEFGPAFSKPAAADTVLTPVKDWKVLGTSLPRPNARDLVTGAHRYPSDIERPGMLRGKVLRAPTYNTKLVSIDLAPAQAMKDVVVFQDGQFVGVAAPTTFRAEQALDAIAKTAKWEAGEHPASKELYDYLRRNAQGGVPKNPYSEFVSAAPKSAKQQFNVAYAQHAPMETRAAVAEWQDGKVTVWTGTQAPPRVQDEIARAFRLESDHVRVIVPDTGGGFGGKHSGEAAVEAARLAKAAGKPVSLKWTRIEEFTWAYFRPAAAIDVEATLDEKGTLTSWHFVNVNSGNAGIESPYRIGKKRSDSVNSNAPLRGGSYRGLAATANNFAREAFMDELADAAGTDPLEFRRAHLENERLRAVLEEAAKRFNWTERVKNKRPDIGVGLACGTEKGSYVAACVEIQIDREKKEIVVRHVCEVFECGAILNPDNLLGQVQGAIIMGLGPALREGMRFENGKMQNASFSDYLVPRLSDTPELDVHLLNRTDLPSAGAGETPIIVVAPAIANAVFHVTGVRIREMPIRFPETKPAKEAL